MPAPRNVLLIVTDQWRGDSLGALGHPAARTPNLDALAAEGVMFKRHFGQSAPCGPARASLLTGQYVMNHRVSANGVPLESRHPTLATAARQAGIDPVMIGYTTTTPDPASTVPQDPRFREIGDVMDGFRIFAHMDEVEFRSYLTWAEARGAQLPMPEPQDIWLPAEGPPGPTDQPSRITAAQSDTAWSGEHALAFLRGVAPDLSPSGWPWLLHLGFYRPHPPFIAPAPYHALVPDSAIPPPIGAASRAEEAAQHPMLAHWLATQKQGTYFHGADGRVESLTPDDIRCTRRAYYGLIAEIDDWVGRIVAALKARGQWEDTLVIFTSDHAEQLGDHGLLGKLGWFDQSYHLPLIIRDPRGGARGRVVEALTESIDIMPTILEWLGADTPASVDGVSLMPWLRGETPGVWRDAVHFEYDLRGGYPRPGTLPPGTRDVGPQTGSMAVMRTETWKYVHIAGQDPVLYDLRADPLETRNIAADPAAQGLLAEAAQRMLTWRLGHAARGQTGVAASPDGLVARTQAR